MTHLNIHWTGYPYRRLPRIRVASRGTSVRSRGIACAAASDSIWRPLGPKLEGQKKKKQRFAFRRRRDRKSRSSSSAVRTRRLASLKARQHIQVFGWDPEIASKADTLRFSSRTTSVREGVDIRPPGSPGGTATGTTIIDSHDGAGASICRSKPLQRENLYSLMHVAEVPVYWSKKDNPNRNNLSIAPNRALRPEEYAHVGPLDPVCRSRTYRTPQQFMRSRTYDNRIDPRALLNKGRPTKSAPVIPSSATRRTASRLSPDNGIQGSKELRKVLESMVAKSDANPHSITPSMKSVVQSLLSDPASRTASQRKALRRYTKEIELYLQAAKISPKQTFIASPSVTTVSAHTVEELKPYKAQLNTAGLAVTSADQRGNSPAMARLTKSRAAPPIPPKDERYSRQSVARQTQTSSQEPTRETHHHHQAGSSPSFDTETTIMDFTPPHEQTSPRPIRTKKRSSSDHTIMAFTPPHDAAPPQPKYAPAPPPRDSTKKSLPWLQQPETVDVSPSHTPRARGIVTASTMKTKTRNPSDVLLSFSIPRVSAVEKTKALRSQVTQRELASPPAEAKWKDVNFRDEINAKIATSKPKIYNDVAVQAVSELAEEYTITDQGVKYVDATAQTDFLDPRPSEVNISRDRSTVEPRAPWVRVKSKTFPVKPTQCVGNCGQVQTGIADTRSFRKEDEEVQTEPIESPPNTKQLSKGESREPAFSADSKTPERNGTYPFASPSPFRSSPMRRSPNKSVDDSEIWKSIAKKQAERVPVLSPELSRASTRDYPSILRCAQCGAEMSLSSTPSRIEPDSCPEAVAGQASLPVSYGELTIHSPRKGQWSHTCTARSSLECPQCAARGTSDAIHRGKEQSVKPITPPQMGHGQSPQRKESAQRAAYLTPDWAATLESNLEEIIKSYRSPEERIVQHKIIADAIAEHIKPPPVPEPVKQSYVPKIRLRPSLPNRPAPKELQPKPERSTPVFFDAVSQSDTATASSFVAQDMPSVSDRAVFRGLHVATAAACDEDVAQWIEEITGTGIRKFLAELSAFDGLGFNTLAGVARRAAKQRRGEIRAWEKLRESQLQKKEQDVDEGWEDCVPDCIPETKVKLGRCKECDECTGLDDQQGRAKDRKMGFMFPDETVNLRAEQPLKGRDKSIEEVIDKMVKAKAGRSRENLREKAVRLGWKDASVSGEV